MKIGLYGIQGVYNFGCEAIVRGACTFLNELYPNCQIVYFSYSSEYDKRILADLKIEIVPIVLNKNFLKKGVNKVAKLINYEKRIFLFDIDSIIDSVDIIVSIGGDIYTIPEIVKQQDKYRYYNSLVDFCERVINRGKKVIVYGASVGPWGGYKKAIEYNIKALKKYKVILCREKESIKYLNRLGLNNVVFFPDPAFQIKKGEVKKKNYIGINLSPLSLKELYGRYDEVYVNKLANLLDRLYEITKFKLMFIPHVISSSESDNDLLFMKKLQFKMKYKDKVVFADTSGGFIGLKEYISECYVVVTARMHCAINAIDENVPAIFLSYSQKSVGMCKYVYGNDEFCINLKSIDNCLLDKVQEVIDKNDYLVEYLKKRNNEIQEYYNDNISKIQTLLNE